MVIGLTGQSGAGKTLLSGIFKEFGFYLISGDITAKNVIDRSERCKEELRDAFGDGVVLKNGCINRLDLAHCVFGDKNELIKLNKITHPYILREVERKVIDLKRDNKNIIIDAAVLFESGMDKLCDYSIFVTAPEDERYERIVKRDKIPRNLAYKRIKSQHGDNFYRDRCDLVFECTGEKSAIIERTNNIINKIGGLSNRYETKS